MLNLSENNIEEAFKYFTKAIDYSEKKEEIYIKNGNFFNGERVYT